MNYQFDAANVNFGDPNAYPTNPNGTRAVNNMPEPSTQNHMQPSQNKNNISYFQKILFFLNSKTGTVLTSAMGMAIGFAFKDFIGAIVINVLQPIVVMIITMTHLNSFYDFTVFISPEKNALNVSTFISSLFTFIFTVVTIYYVNIMISTPI